jgi:hypothetical protein
MAWITTSWRCILSTPSAVGRGEAFGGLATATSVWPSSRLAVGVTPLPRAWVDAKSIIRILSARARARATAARVAKPRWPLACQLAHFAVALPPTPCRVVECGLALVSPLMSTLLLKREVGIRTRHHRPKWNHHHGLSGRRVLRPCYGCGGAGGSLAPCLLGEGRPEPPSPPKAMCNSSVESPIMARSGDGGLLQVEPMKAASELSP